MLSPQQALNHLPTKCIDTIGEFNWQGLFINVTIVINIIIIIIIYYQAIFHLTAYLENALGFEARSEGSRELLLGCSPSAIGLHLHCIT